MNIRTIAAAIIAAINSGSVMYNRGDVAGCADLYIVTSVELLSDPAISGYPKSVLSSALAAATQEGPPQQTFDQQAWTMRKAFDAVLEFVQQSAEPLTCQEASGAEETEDKLVFNNEAACQWSQMHDGVMGGVSSGQMSYDATTPADPCAVFSGVIRTEYNGGFASVRKGLALDGRGWDGIFLDVASDDPTRVYSVNVKDPACVQLGGVNFKSKFALAASSGALPTRVSRLLLPFSSFIPELRGRRVNVPPLGLNPTPNPTSNPTSNPHPNPTPNPTSNPHPNPTPNPNPTSNPYPNAAGLDVGTCPCF